MPRKMMTATVSSNDILVLATIITAVVAVGLLVANHQKAQQLLNAFIYRLRPASAHVSRSTNDSFSGSSLATSCGACGPCSVQRPPVHEPGTTAPGTENETGPVAGAAASCTRNITAATLREQAPPTPGQIMPNMGPFRMDGMLEEAADGGPSAVSMPSTSLLAPFSDESVYATVPPQYATNRTAAFVRPHVAGCMSTLTEQGECPRGQFFSCDLTPHNVNICSWK